jgi:hypothetical protein
VWLKPNKEHEVRKLIIGALVVGAVFAGPGVAQADASTYCRVSAYDTNRSGHGISYSGASASGMNCASVRYALRQFRAKVRRQYGYPRMPRSFFDGYVTWSCWKTGGHGIKCWEPQSGTSYRFRAWVW